MKLTKSTITAALVTLSATAVAHAHPGHDHGEASSGLIHLLWIGLPLATAAAIVLFRSSRRKEK